jgi:hypothetical protein
VVGGATFDAPDGMWMAQRLARAIPNVASFGTGTAWSCKSADDPGGIKAVFGDDDGPTPITRDAVRLADGSIAYTGHLHVGPASASPPVVSSRSRR